MCFQLTHESKEAEVLGLTRRRVISRRILYCDSSRHEGSKVQRFSLQGVVTLI